MPDEQPQVGPPTLNHVIGQREVVERVQVALEASWADGRRFDHSLMCGPAGVGKTMLANIVAREMGSDIRECLGQTIDVGALQGLLLEVGDKDCLFIDEIHTLDEEGQHLLLRALEQRQLFVPRGSTRKSTTTIPLADFTLLGATTDEWGLIAPLRDRFKLLLAFDYYSVEELTKVLRQRAQSLRWSVNDQVVADVAARGRGTPRIAIRLLEACYRVARSVGSNSIEPEHFTRAMLLEGVDRFGLDKSQQRLLSFLEEAGGAVRLNVLASRLGLPAKTVAEVIEPYLIREGLIDKSNGGRGLTGKGLDHVRSSRTSV